MSFRTRAIVFGYPLAEVVTFWIVGEALGWAWAVVLLLVGIPAGWALVKIAIAEARRGKSESALGLGVAGVLVMMPGFLTDLAGALVLLPPVRRSLESRLRTWVDMSPIRMGFVTTETVRGELIRVELDQAERGSAP